MHVRQTPRATKDTRRAEEPERWAQAKQQACIAELGDISCPYEHHTPARSRQIG